MYESVFGIAEVCTLLTLMVIIAAMVIAILRSSIKHRIALVIATLLLAATGILALVAYGMWRIRRFMYPAPLYRTIGAALRGGAWMEIVVTSIPLIVFAVYAVSLTIYLVLRSRRSNHKESVSNV